MTQIKRVEMKRIVQPMLTQAFLSIYEGKYCKPKQLKLEFKRYANGGFLAYMDNFSYGVMVNIYQDGEVSFQEQFANIKQERIVCLEGAEMYDDVEVYDKVQHMLDHIKASVKHRFGD